MRIAYGDLIGGISGDMFVGALLDLGLPLNKLKTELKKIPGLKYRIEVSKKKLHAIRATRFRVLCDATGHERGWREIRRLIERSPLAPGVKETTGLLLSASEVSPRTNLPADETVSQEGREVPLFPHHGVCTSLPLIST